MYPIYNNSLFNKDSKAFLFLSHGCPYTTILSWMNLRISELNIRTSKITINQEIEPHSPAVQIQNNVTLPSNPVAILESRNHAKSTFTVFFINRTPEPIFDKI